MNKRVAPAIQRLDHYITARLPELSRSFATKLIERGKVTVNGLTAKKAGQKIQTKDAVLIDYDPIEFQAIPDITLPVLYEDVDCVVINKPSGVLSHSKGAFNPEATVATWLAKRVPAMNGQRAGIVHRLDRGTSGVMIVAKTPEALAWLQKQFSQRKTKKTYVAIAAGTPKQAEAIIDMPIERNPKLPTTFRVGVHGKTATTHYRVIKSNKSYSELELMPTTGRTHQLRVHLKQLGHPIVGDSLYGGQPADRLMLHAWKLELTLPNRERQTFTAAVPREFQTALKDKP